jgi:hypothetical protein
MKSSSARARIHKAIDEAADELQEDIRRWYRREMVCVDMEHLTRFEAFVKRPGGGEYLVGIHQGRHKYDMEVARCAIDRIERGNMLLSPMERRYGVRIPDFLATNFA